MSTYKLLDWRGKLPGEAWSNIGSGPHIAGRKVIHYSGDDAQIYRDLRSGRISLFDLIKWETEYQMTRGLYVAGFATNGMMYHEVIWEDVVAIVRNADAWLYHCADGMIGPTWNKTARSIHVPLTTGVRASSRTVRTMQERCDDLDRESGIGLAGRKLTLGHQEISSTACPGTLMGDFVLPYRSGRLTPAPPEKFEKWPLAKYNFVSGSEEWGDPRCRDAVAMINEAAGKTRTGTPLAAWTGDPERAVYASQKAYDSPAPAGKLVTVAVGEKAVQKLSAQAESVFGKYGKGESDIWDGRYTGELWECIRAIAKREKLSGLAARWNKEYGGSPKGRDEEEKPSPAPKPPAPQAPNGLNPAKSREAGIIDRYFGTGYGQTIVEEADRAGLALNAACALVEQESNGRNIFGADWGTRGADRIPFAHMPVTEARVKALVGHVRAGGVSNGVGLTQLTWRDFLYEAESLGGAHLVRNQLRVGFKLLASYFGKYGEQDGYGSYNAGEGNRASVRGTYSASCIAKSRAWRSRLG